MKKYPDELGEFLGLSLCPKGPLFESLEKIYHSIMDFHGYLDSPILEESLEKIIPAIWEDIKNKGWYTTPEDYIEVQNVS